MQIFRSLFQLSIIILVVFFDFKYSAIGKFLVPLIIFFGVFYCGWLCPFGAIQDFINKISKKLKIKRYKIPDKYQKYLSYLRYFIYSLVYINLIVIVFNPRHDFGSILRGDILSIINYIVLILFLVVSVFIDRPWCNYFCEKGAFYGLLSSFRLFSIKRDNDKCIHCHLCDKACPMNIKIENKKFVNHPHCIGCFECISSCPKKSLKYTKCK